MYFISRAFVPGQKNHGRRRAPACLSLAAALLTFAVSASAETPQQIAENHFKAGLKLYNQNNFEGARLAFLQGQAVFPRTSLLRNLALCELKTNRPLDALRHLRGYLSDPASDVRDYAKKNLDDAYARTGHVAVRAVEGAALTIDGQLEGNAPFKEVLDVSVGKHVLETSLNDRHAKREVDAVAGAVVEGDLVFEEAKNLAIAHPSLVPAQAPGEAVGVEIQPPTEGDPSGGGARVLVSASLALVGVAGGVAGAVFFSKADQSIAATKALAPGDPRYATQREEWSKNRTIGWVSVGAGAAFLAGAAVTFFAWPKATSTSGSVTAFWTGTGAGVSGSF